MSSILTNIPFYLGMAFLDNSSGKYKGTKSPRQVNKRAKTAMMVVIVDESKSYYEKKRAEGKVTTKDQSIYCCLKKLYYFLAG